MVGRSAGVGHSSIAIIEAVRRRRREPVQRAPAELEPPSNARPGARAPAPSRPGPSVARTGHRAVRASGSRCASGVLRRGLEWARARPRVALHSHCGPRPPTATAPRRSPRPCSESSVPVAEGGPSSRACSPRSGSGVASGPRSRARPPRPHSAAPRRREAASHVRGSASCPRNRLPRRIDSRPAAVFLRPPHRYLQET